MQVLRAMVGLHIPKQQVYCYVRTCMIDPFYCKLGISSLAQVMKIVLHKLFVDTIMYVLYLIIIEKQCFKE